MKLKQNHAYTHSRSFSSKLHFLGICLSLFPVCGYSEFSFRETVAAQLRVIEEATDQEKGLRLRRLAESVEQLISADFSSEHSLRESSLRRVSELLLNTLVHLNARGFVLNNGHRGASVRVDPARNLFKSIELVASHCSAEFVHQLATAIINTNNSRIAVPALSALVRLIQANSEALAPVFIASEKRNELLQKVENLTLDVERSLKNTSATPNRIHFERAYTQLREALAYLRRLQMKKFTDFEAYYRQALIETENPFALGLIIVELEKFPGLDLATLAALDHVAKKAAPPARDPAYELVQRELPKALSRVIGLLESPDARDGGLPALCIRFLIELNAQSNGQVPDPH